MSELGKNLGLLCGAEQERAENIFTVWESRDRRTSGTKDDARVKEKSMSNNADN